MKITYNWNDTVLPKTKNLFYQCWQHCHYKKALNELQKEPTHHLPTFGRTTSFWIKSFSSVELIRFVNVFCLLAFQILLRRFATQSTNRIQAKGVKNCVCPNAAASFVLWRTFWKAIDFRWNLLKKGIYERSIKSSFILSIQGGAIGQRCFQR